MYIIFCWLKKCVYKVIIIEYYNINMFLFFNKIVFCIYLLKIIYVYIYIYIYLFILASANIFKDNYKKN